MKHQYRLPDGEFNKWLDIEVSLGKNQSLIRRDLRSLFKLVSKFTEQEMLLLEKASSLNRHQITPDSPMQPALIRLLLIKKFIDRNNLSMIAKSMNLDGEGLPLEKKIYLEIAQELFAKGIVPINQYKFCTFCEMGRPTTWLKINDVISESDIQTKVHANIYSLCRRLSRRFDRKRLVRHEALIDDQVVYFIEKGSRADVVRNEGRNREVQRVVYSVLVIDLRNKKIGYVSRDRKEIGEVNLFIKRKIFPDNVFSQRKDFNYSSTKLFNELILDNQDIPIIKLELRRSNLPENPALALATSNDSPLQESITNLRNVLDGLGIEDIGTVGYRLSGQNFYLYSFGEDEWQRRYINIRSRKQLQTHEIQALNAIRGLIGIDIKEARFIVEDFQLEHVVKKILIKKKISIEPAIPAAVEKIITELMEAKLLKPPRSQTKRLCLNCKRISWTTWACPNCKKEMVIVGEQLSIKVSESTLLQQLSAYLKKHMEEHEVMKKAKQRRGIKKSLIQIINNKTRVGTYILYIASNRDVRFAEELEKDGFGLIAIMDNEAKNHTDRLRSIGSDIVELHQGVVALVQFLRNSNDESRRIVELVDAQEKGILRRIYSALKTSQERLRKDTDSNEVHFEIDIKNILQGIIPEVIRLGTEYKGKPVPDGYCAYKLPKRTSNNIFGWDAKFSESNNYSLSQSDFTKQKGYIRWLCITKECKAVGKLGIYAIISNLKGIEGFARTLTSLSKISAKPRMCRIILLDSALLDKLAEWKLRNWQKVLERGPDIAKLFFNWLKSNERTRFKRKKWRTVLVGDWENLEQQLEAL